MTDPAAAFDPRAVRGIVFDLDGTLVDSYGAIADSLNFARAARGLAPRTVDEVRARVGHGLEVLIAEELGAGHVAEGVRRFRERYAEVFRDGTRALPGARAALDGLAGRGYRLSVASNKPARFSEAILDALGMLPALDCVQGPDRIGSTKPDPAMIEACLRTMGVRAAEALYVGDMVLDVDSGRRAGVPVVLVEGGSSPPDALRATGLRVLDSVERLLELLPARAPASA